MNDEFFKRLLNTFKIEAAEHLKSISEELIKYEKSSSDDEKTESINIIFRGAHSLKGASRAVNLGEIEGYCQTLESVFALVRDGILSTSFRLIDEIHKGIDTISNFLQETDDKQKLFIAREIDSLATILSGIAKGESPTQAEKPKSKKSVTRISKKPDPVIIAPESKKTEPGEKIIPLPEEKTKTRNINDAKLQDTIRVTTHKLDALFLKSEEMLSCKLEADDLLKNLADLRLLQESYKKNLEQLTTLVSIKNTFSQNDMNKLQELYGESAAETEKKLNSISKQAYHYNKKLSAMVSQLVDEMKEILMLPFSYLSDVFPKMVRELARDLNKEIEFEIKGSNIELDRRILEEMKDAMIHLIRNSIDHGIESPEVREQNGKERQGKIILEVKKEGGDKIEISLSDNGAGINYESIRSTAVRKNIFNEKDAATLTEEQLLELLFHPNFSTSQVITDISGRGVGMSVVKEKINRLNGSVKIFSKINEGTSFKILLPLTLAKIRAIILRCTNQIYALQTLNVDRVMRIKSESIKTVKNRATINYNSIPIPLCNLAEVLGIRSEAKKESQNSNIIVIKIADNIVAFQVDEILHEQEIIIKKLNRQLENAKFVNGATMLGDGSVIPVLNTHDLLKEIKTHSFSSEIKEKPKSIRKQELLIADDSITSRMLIRDILESSGYNVKMVVDGKEAYAELKTKNYDLVISDVEMPRLNGFELTEKIRSDSDLKRLPVILLTSLAKKEDREKGIDAGANAYIVKSGFDQSNLLDTIERLI